MVPCLTQLTPSGAEQRYQNMILRVSHSQGGCGGPPDGGHALAFRRRCRSGSCSKTVHMRNSSFVAVSQPEFGTGRRVDPTVWRQRLAWFAVAACAPYLTLKLLWVAGVDVGVVDPGSLNRAQWVAANLLTFVMDGIAAFIAHVLTRPRDNRMRAWLIVLPLWIASGLLSVIMLAVPLSMAGAAVGGGTNPFAGDDFLRPWVFAVVYGGFIVEGLMLLAAFALYAHERWGQLLRTRVRDLPDASGTRDAQRFFGTVAAALLAGAGALRLIWASGSEMGMTDRWVEHRDGIGQWMDLVQGSLCLIAAAGLLMLAYRLGSARIRVPLSMAWFGAGSAFTWGGALGMLGILAAPDSEPAERSSGLLRLVLAAEMAAGILVVTAGWFVLAESGGRLSRTTDASAHTPRDV